MSALLAILFVLAPVSPGAWVGSPVVSVLASLRADDPAPARGVWPLAPRPSVVRGFDPPQERWGRGHRGVDLAGVVGQPVRAALGGRITFAGRLAGRGVVVVDHGGVRTTYEPVRSTVHVGDVVSRGARIGVLQRGSSHCFPRACLHWGLLRGRTYLNPLTLVGAGPLRLLPQTAPWPSTLSMPWWTGRMAPSPPPAPSRSGRLRPVGAPVGRPHGAVRT